ncbi:MAG: NAD-binding protein [Haloarculaceae archaeon]
MAEDGPTRRQVLGTRTAVLLATAAAVLSLATGIANITVQQTTGPLADYIPPAIQQAAGFTGTLTGFLLLTSAYELRQGYRVGWYATVALLPITAVQGLVQGSVFSLPLVVLSVLSLPALLVNYRRFDRKTSFSTAQLAATVSLVGTLVYGTAGAYALREEFAGVASLTDALYYTVATASTVGYGDAAPQSAQARLFGISLIVLGTASFALALGSVLGPAIQARFSRALGTMTTTQYDLYENHVVVLGYGDLTEPLVEELRDGNTKFVIITPDSSRAAALRDQGFDVLVGDPSDEEPLEDAGVGHARAIIAATNDDADDAFAILTARELNPDARIVAAATNRDNVEKLRRAGADTVLSPALIGGRLLVRSALGESNVEDIAERMMEE